MSDPQTVATEHTRLPWHPDTVPLPPPGGQVIKVCSTEGLLAAVDSVRQGGTIEIADGLYHMPTVMTITTDNVTVRSASGNRDTVVLDATHSDHNELIAFTECRGVTVADLTIRNVIHNGFKLNANIGHGVKAITLHNCVIHNIWQRGVKSVDGPEADEAGDLPLRPGKAGKPPQARHYVDDCVIRYCLFYNDRPKRLDDEPFERRNPQTFGGNYIAAIDAMSARNWHVHDNVFSGIRGLSGGARGAIFFWQGSQDVRIEDNVIVDCDSGMWLGLAWTPGDTRRCRGYTVTGNKITRPGRTGILLNRHVGSRVSGNTIYDPFTSADRVPATDIDDGGVLIAGGAARCRPLRVGSENDGLLIDNNLLVCDDDLHVSATAGRIELRDNFWCQVASPQPFVNADAGDLRKTDAGQCLNAGAE